MLPGSASRSWTSSWFLFEALHEVRASAEARVALEAVQDEGIGFDLGSAGWGRTVLALVQRSWVMWKWEQANQAEVEERRVILRKLTEEESYKLHLAHDHVPYRKGCPVCVQAQGRQRSHWRSGFPGMHSLSVDVAGPFVSGQSWDVEASGRDRGKGYKYFLACAYAIPGGFDPVDKVMEDCAEYEPSELGAAWKALIAASLSPKSEITTSFSISS